MRRRCDYRGDMRRLRTRAAIRDGMLDESTAERLVGGALAPDDAPPDYRTVASLIEQLGAPATEHERAQGADVVVSMLVVLSPESSQTTPAPRRTSMSNRRFTQLAAAATVGVMTLFGGLVAATALPGAAGGAAQTVVGNLGLGSSGTPDDHADVRGQSDARSQADPNTTTPTSVDPSLRADGIATAAGNVPPDSTAKGVLDTLTTGVPGPGLGAAVAAAASDGKAQVPTSVPPAPAPAVPPTVPSAASDGPGGSHVPTSLPAGGRP
jgi:hypothetical protein